MIGDMPMALYGWASAEMMILTQSNQTYGENRCQTDKAFRTLRAAHALTSDAYALHPLEEGYRWQYALRNGIPLVELQGPAEDSYQVLGIGIPDQHEIGLANFVWRSRFFVKQPAWVSRVLVDVMTDDGSVRDHLAYPNLLVTTGQTLHLVFQLDIPKMSWLVTGSGEAERPVDRPSVRDHHA